VAGLARPVLIAVLGVLAAVGCGGDESQDERCGEPSPAPVGAHCSAETARCVRACSDQLCQVDCTTKDTTQNADGVTCAGCFGQVYRACLELTACREQYAALRCCSEEHCGGVDLSGADPATDSCAACNSALEATGLCAYSADAVPCVETSLAMQWECLGAVP